MKEALIAWIFLSAVCLGQSTIALTPPIVVNGVGQPLGGVSVAICNSNPGATLTPPCQEAGNSLAFTYANANLSPNCIQNPVTLGPLNGAGCSNPGLTDGFGNAVVFSTPSPGLYWYEVYGQNITTYAAPVIFPITAYIAAAGVFNNTSQNYFAVNINGMNFANEWTGIGQGSSLPLSGITSGVVLPNSAYRAAIAISGYIDSGCNASVNGCAGVAGYFQAQGTNGASLFGLNPIVSVATGQSVSNMRGEEIDFNMKGSATGAAYGLWIDGVSTGTFPPGPPLGFNNGQGNYSAGIGLFEEFASSTTTWPAGFVTGKGSVSGNGVQLDANCFTATSCPSQAIEMAANNGTTPIPAVIQVFPSAPSGSCPSDALGNNTVTLGINGGAASNSTILYVCYHGSTWQAVTVP